MSIPRLGILEGFYGRCWSDQDRLDTIAWSARAGFSDYIYAPKSETSLRSAWAEPFPSQLKQRLKNLSACCAEYGIRWGVGLSPLGAVNQFGRKEQSLLAAKLEVLEALQLDCLAVLFDDMCCDHADLAERQVKVLEFVRERQLASQLIMCPTYYSCDPVLERVFGPMPDTYWDVLGQELSPEVGVFWTGNKVCSTSIAAEDLEHISRRLRRPLTLWDNYPVNDGERASNFLHINPFSGRDPNLGQWVDAHYANPMNQCHLSRLALATLPNCYGAGGPATPPLTFMERCSAELGNALACELTKDREAMTEIGLHRLSLAQRREMLERYKPHTGSAAQEIRDWLNGEYVFDPACLTEAMP